MRIIPKNSKIKTEFFKGLTIGDMIFCFICALINVFILTSNIPYKYIFLLVGVALSVFLMFKLDNQRTYVFVIDVIRHLSYRKRFAHKTAKKPPQTAEVVEEAEKSDKKAKKSPKESDIRDIVPWTGIKDGFIEYGKEYYGAVLEIPPVEFRFFSEFRQSNSIDRSFAAVLRDLPADYSANLIKLDRPVNYDQYISDEQDKKIHLEESYVNGLLTEEELRVRLEEVAARAAYLQTLSSTQKTVLPFFYLALYDSDRTRLGHQVERAKSTLETGELHPKRLDDRELALFLRYSNEIDFDEKEIDRLTPEEYYKFTLPDNLIISPRTTEINHMVTHNLRVISYPLTVGNAWGADLFATDGIKVVMKFKPIEQYKAIKAIDNSLDELRSRLDNTGKTSRMIEIETHIETLTGLLEMLQNNNETLLQTNIYVTAYDAMLTEKTPSVEQKGETVRPRVNMMKKTVRRRLSELSFRVTDQMFQQFEGVVGSQISAYDPKAIEGREIHSSTVAAVFPFVYPTKSDKGGVFLGKTNEVPTFFNFFRRDSDHVNSNMVIIGKSGSGKSYATKTLLANLAAENSKIFVLDPESEYTELARNLNGKIINAGNAAMGRINPFHIITTLEDDEGMAESGGSFASHLQFLEEFFRQILTDITPDAIEYLNSLISQVYFDRDIDAQTDLSTLQPKDFPTFDDLYDKVLREFQTTKSEYLRTNLRVLMNHLSKFASGGRNAQLWNGESTISTEENFIVFDFQSLLANRNNTVSNAQMLLILKWLDNEIIKNREYNEKYKQERKIVVVIDEAHVFIDNKYPLALDFMFQLAKRIRKYNGMQIVITQNIKDFVGSEEIARKSTAIINACQYSFIFSLAPNDMNDLCVLYEKAGGINEQEQEAIINAKRGSAFVITSPTSRTDIQIEALPLIRELFSSTAPESLHYKGPEGEKEWKKTVDELAPYRKERSEHTVAARMAKPRSTAPQKQRRNSFVNLVEVSEAAVKPSVTALPKQKAVKVETVENPKGAKSEPAVKKEQTQEAAMSSEAMRDWMTAIQKQMQLMEERLQQALSKERVDVIPDMPAAAVPVTHEEPVLPVMSVLDNIPTEENNIAQNIPPVIPQEEEDPFADWLNSAADDLVALQEKAAQNAKPEKPENTAEEIVQTKAEKSSKGTVREISLSDLL